MKKRITFVHAADGEFNPEQITVKDDSLSVQSLDAARQERVTFAVDELPQEVWQVLKQCHELHIRWSSQYVYDAVPPFASRVSPGLHVFYTPVDQDRPATRLCPLLLKVFDDKLKCYLPETSFISPPILSRTFISNPPLQFHQLLPSLDEFVKYIQHKICPRLGDEQKITCESDVASLLSADSVDIDYDSVSHTLTTAGYWSKPPQRDGWTETISKRKKSTDKVEVGILAMERARLPEELSMGGFLAVVGEDKKLKPTLFSFPSRHHPLPNSSKYTTTFRHPTGLHPTLQLSITRSALTATPPRAPPDSKCGLHTYLTLPSSVFADKYQLSTTDPLFLQSHNLVSLRAIAGETDLEAPDWVTERWGSSLLLELATPPSSNTHKSTHGNRNDDNDNDWQVTIPLHLRYLHPSPSGYRNISVPWPVIFWACTPEDEEREESAADGRGKMMAINPFDRVRLGWDGLFAPGTLFYQLHPDTAASTDGDAHVHLGAERGMMVEKIQVPVLRIDDGNDGGLLDNVRSIEMVTLVVVVFGFLWVLRSLGRVVKEGGLGSGGGRRDLRAREKRE
ncbi:pbn1 [Blastomyces dermatitidis ATCC 18188]|uniref:Protein PBN1 n=1 Tax=Ajellomyces dermatitidis (strain ATCC 18188 / CBS 674.68) TaxID=653446 RepID=F2T9D1_AJEDA|nr:pbn1 [Blastomyces dermatitidis ATCC 18188]